MPMSAVASKLRTRRTIENKTKIILFTAGRRVRAVVGMCEALLKKKCRRRGFRAAQCSALCGMCVCAVVYFSALEKDRSERGANIFYTMLKNSQDKVFVFIIHLCNLK